MRPVITQHQHKVRADLQNSESIKKDRTVLDAGTVHPKRIWDLYANRVIPYEFSGLPYDLNPQDTPLPTGVPQVLDGCINPYTDPVFGARGRFAISHSWVKNLKPADTPVNAHEWPVPLPSDITLEDLRRALLALGAEYIWLDVLCLRQAGGKLDEWAIDVPTIGFIYRNADYVVGYFNGLGKKFSRYGWKDPRHWSQRAWTFQEDVGQAIIDVGNKDDLSQPAEDDPTLVLSELLNPNKPGVDLEVSPRSIHNYARLMAERSASNPVDRIAGLASLLGCKDMPVYKADEPVEEAWLRLPKHVPETKRICMITQSPLIGQGCCSWHLSWWEVMRTDPATKFHATEHHFFGKAYIMEKCQIRRQHREDLEYDVTWEDITLHGKGIARGIIEEGEFTLVAEPRNYSDETQPIATAWAICREIESGALQKVGNFMNLPFDRGFEEEMHFKITCPVKDITFR